MANWGLLWRLIPLVFIAAVVGIHGQVRSLAALQGSGPPGWNSYAGPTAAFVLIGLAASWIGTAAAARVGLDTPVLCPTDGVVTASRHLLWGVAGGILVAALTLPFYYRFMGPRFDPGDLATVEAIRRGMGLPARLAFGGVIEEVVYRWGILAAVAWLGMLATGKAGPGVRWAAVLLSALLFGLGHLPGAAGLGIRMTPVLKLAGLAMNGVLGVVAGWLVWKHGLAAAITAHSTVHIAWFVVERAGIAWSPQ